MKKIFSELAQLIIQRTIGVLSKYSKETPLPEKPILLAASEIVEIDETDEFGPDDYGFVIGPDGGLKSLMIPEILEDDPPKEVRIILEMFGIHDVQHLENRTLH